MKLFQVENPFSPYNSRSYGYNNQYFIYCEFMTGFWTRHFYIVAVVIFER